MSDDPEEPAAEDPPDSEAATDDEAAAPETGLQPGDFVKLAYTARTIDEGTLVDTTDESIAEEEGVADQGTFEPRTIVLGEGMLFEAVEDDIIGTEVGDTGTVVVELAFGEYDQEAVRTVSSDRIPEDDRYPGAQVQIDNEQGRLETIVGGRARVDFNHPLAGEDIEYEYEVLDTVDDTLERARGLFDMYLDLDLELWLQTDEVEEERMVEPDEDATEDDAETAPEGDEDEPPEPEFETVTVEKESLYVEATPQLTMNQGWMFQKHQLAEQIIGQLGIDRIVVQEVLDGSPMGGMGGMMGGMPGAGASEADIEEAIEEMDVDADEIVEELEQE